MDAGGEGAAEVSAKAIGCLVDGSQYSEHRSLQVTMGYSRSLTGS